MTKQDFEKTMAGVTQKVLGTRVFLRKEIFRLAPEHRHSELDNYLCGFGMGGHVEEECLNADFARFEEVIKAIGEDAVLDSGVLHLLRKKIGQERFEEVLHDLDKQELGLAKKARKASFVFEDIADLPDSAVQTLLKNIDMQDLAMSFKICGEKTKKKILANMTQRAGSMLLEDVEYMGPVRLKDVEEAEEKILDVFFRCVAKGEITMQG